jgi:signal transduction histidine kinase
MKNHIFGGIGLHMVSNKALKQAKGTEEKKDGILWNIGVPAISGQLFSAYLEDVLIEAGVDVLNFDSGNTIFREFEKGDCAYFVGKGKVELSCSGYGGGKRILAVVGPGEIFGEMVLLDNLDRSATALTTEKCKLYAISSVRSKQLFKDIPQLSIWILNVLTSRLRRADSALSQMVRVHEVNRQILSGQEAERKRIGRELHDGPAQAFADYIMRLQIIERLITVKPDVAIEEVKLLKETITSGLDKIREAICNIHPKELQQAGLTGAIQLFANRVCDGCGLHFNFDCYELPESMEPSLEAALYCIVQEAVNNIKKHGQAKNVNILMAEDENELVLTISDDGCGFDVENMMANYGSRKSYGLSSMEERASLSGGIMNIKSAPGEGTTLNFRIPLCFDSENRKED